MFHIKRIFQVVREVRPFLTRQQVFVKQILTIQCNESYREKSSHGSTAIVAIVACKRITCAFVYNRSLILLTFLSFLQVEILEQVKKSAERRRKDK